jgi:hypothetical protein
VKGGKEGQSSKGGVAMKDIAQERKKGCEDIEILSKDASVC